jgi:small subunit ribosomal protein S21
LVKKTFVKGFAAYQGIIIFATHLKLNNMLVIQVKEGDNIERALKKYKRKFEKTKVLRELRARQAFTKPSVINREANKKAVYVEGLRRAEGEA